MQKCVKYKIFKRKRTVVTIKKRIVGKIEHGSNFLDTQSLDSYASVRDYVSLFFSGTVHRPKDVHREEGCTA